jgi:hypothetical protein
MEFRRYEKIHRLGKEETEGILVGKVHVMEKIDGANASIWKENDTLCTGSRSRYLGNDNFNGFGTFVQSHEGIKKALEENPTLRLYGEWLVRHTIVYKETSYKKFYLFDVFDGEKYWSTDKVIEFAKKYDIPYAEYYGTFENPTVEQLEELVGKSSLGDKGEGIVLKNFDFVNKFGDICYAKIVKQEFMEENAIIFGGNNKHSETYWEMYIVNKYMTLARIEKIIHKIESEVGSSLGLEHTSRIINTAYHDMLTEEIWDIAKKAGKIDFKSLSHLSLRKAAVIYKDIINNTLSVGYTNETINA